VGSGGQKVRRWEDEKVETEVGSRNAEVGKKEIGKVRRWEDWKWEVGMRNAEDRA